MGETGNPKVLVRIDKDTLATAQAAFPATHGAPGGVALALRRLLHLALGVPLPRQYGEPEDREDPIDDLEERLRLIESDPATVPKRRLERARSETRDLLATTCEPVQRLRLLSVLGRLDLLRDPI